MLSSLKELYTDISSSQKAREDLCQKFKTFTSKGAFFKYLGLPWNQRGYEELKKIAKIIDFDIVQYFNQIAIKKEIYYCCKQCGKNFKPKYKAQKFCCQSCSVSYNNKIRKRIKKQKAPKKKIKPCSICGQIHTNGREGICKMTRCALRKLVCFGFDQTKIGTVLIFDELKKVTQLLYQEYWINGLSCAEIKEKYNYPLTAENIRHILIKLDIKIRPLPDAEINALMHNRGYAKGIKSINNYQFKCGWLTTWDGHLEYYRSNLELKVATALNEANIKYLMEGLRILYYDSVRQKERVAIPDFYLPSFNVIIEVKSKATFIKQNMIDKFRKYKELGYHSYLFYENKYYTPLGIEFIEEAAFVLGKKQMKNLV